VDFPVHRTYVTAQDNFAFPPFQGSCYNKDCSCYNIDKRGNVHRGPQGLVLWTSWGENGFGGGFAFAH
jgi:hypothetical protein